MSDSPMKFLELIGGIVFVFATIAASWIFLVFLFSF